jgi:hypothetical protein
MEIHWFRSLAIVSLDTMSGPTSTLPMIVRVSSPEHTMFANQLGICAIAQKKQPDICADFTDHHHCHLRTFIEQE